MNVTFLWPNKIYKVAGKIKVGKVTRNKQSFLRLFVSNIGFLHNFATFGINNKVTIELQYASTVLVSTSAISLKRTIYIQYKSKVVSP